MNSVPVWTSHPVFCNCAEHQLLTERWLDVRTSGLFPDKPSSSPRSLQASVSRPCNISGRYYFPLQTNKTTLYFKCHRRPFFKILISTFVQKRAAHEKNPYFHSIVSFGLHLLWQASVGGTVPLPRVAFNVKCLEILGSVSFLLSFIVMLKIVQNKEYFNGPWRPVSWGRVCWGLISCFGRDVLDWKWKEEVY